ncbi:MAG: hypothetical protein ACRDD8_16480 [Bacteroidales bacterium]
MSKIIKLYRENESLTEKVKVLEDKIIELTKREKEVYYVVEYRALLYFGCMVTEVERSFLTNDISKEVIELQLTRVKEENGNMSIVGIRNIYEVDKKGVSI